MYFFLAPKSASCSLHIRHFLLILSFLGTLCTRVGITVSQDHAYIPTEDNLLYLVEDMVVPIKREEAFSKESPESWKDDSGSVTVLGSPIGFEPGELDFGGQPIGVPVLRKVRIHNLNAESSIQMLSISGNTVHFHCSFFAAKVIPPLGNTTFDVVFLSREKKGPVENTLYVHTSAGSFRFNVKARGAGDPYGLNPMTGIKLPLNTTYNRTISLHNPGPEPIQVLEMISSGSNDLSLVSPDGEIERPKNSWTIPPFTTKVLMLAKFFARKEKNYTAYIRIRTNATFFPGKFLYVPFEALVVENVGIFAPDPLLDFGIFVLGVKDGPVTKDCNVYSTGFKKLVPLKLNKYEENLEPKVVASHFPLASPYLTSIASFTFTPTIEGLFEGFVEITSLDKLYKAIWKYKALVINGSLTYDTNSTSFYVENDSKQFIQKVFSLKNGFKIPVKVTGIKMLHSSSHFSLHNFQPVVLSPGEEKDILVIAYNISGDTADFIQESTICILTDVYNLNVTFRAYDGKIQKTLPDSPSQDYLDFGSLGMAVTRDSTFILTNRNPVNVSISKMNSNCSGCSLECSEELWKMIPAGESITFCLRIVTSENEGSVQAQIFIQTEYESLTIPLRYRVVRGSLTTVPEDLEFAPVFPGEKAELKLTVYSSFAQEMITNDVVTIPRDDSFSFQHGVLRGRNVIMSVEKSYIGKVIFDPAQGCRQTQSCYVGFEMESKLGQFWLSALNATTRVEIMDITEIIVKILRQRYIFSLNSQQAPDLSYKSFISRDLPSLVNNVTLSLNTNQIRGFLFRAKTRMIWPFVVQEEKVNFSYTQIGNSSIGYCNLKNPSSVYPLFIHLVMVPLENSPFQILSIESEEAIQGLPHASLKNSKSFVLPPSNSVRVKLQFRPTRVFTEADNLLVRNNLTGGEVVWLVGNGSSPSFRLGLWKTNAENIPSLSGNLGFEIKEKDLQACDIHSQEKKQLSQVLTVRDSFKARNTGDVPIWILGFYIGEYPCEGYGFKVVGCKPFRLDPNSARDIEIAFTPDFTVSYIEQTLHIHSTLDKRTLNYTLSASIPPKMLPVCAAILPRPMWEAWIYYVLNLGLLVVFLGVLLAAKLETNCIWSFYESSTSNIIEVQKIEDPDVDEPELSEEISSKSEGLRQRRVNQRQRSSDNKRIEDESSPHRIGLKGHFNSLLDMVVPRSKSKSPSIPEESKTPLNKTCSSVLSSNKNKKKKQKNNAKKMLDEADSSSTTTESSNVEELTDMASPPLPKQEPSSSQKSDLKKTKNSKKNNKKSSSPSVPLAESVQPISDLNLDNLDFSQPVTKKTRPYKNQKASEETNDKKPVNSSTKSSNVENASTQSPVHTPPPQQRKKQAKVKPNEAMPSKSNIVARNSSPSVFDKPPRMLPKTSSSSINDKASNPTLSDKGKKVPPVGKILPEIKQTAGSQYGPIGAPRRVEPKRGDPNRLHGHQINPIQENSGLALGSADTFGVSPHHRSSTLANNNTANNTGSGGPSSLMQSLQAERRQRTEEFLLKNRRPVDWPGFDNNNQNNNLLESLWDRPEEVHDVWGHRGFGGSSNGSGGGIWPNTFWGPSQSSQQITHFNSSQNNNNSGGGDVLYSQQVTHKEPYDAQNYYHLSSIWAGSEDERQQQQQTQQQQQQQQQQQSQSSRSETWSSTLFHTNQI